MEKQPGPSADPGHITFYLIFHYSAPEPRFLKKNEERTMYNQSKRAIVEKPARVLSGIPNAPAGGFIQGELYLYHPSDPRSVGRLRPDNERSGPVGDQQPRPLRIPVLAPLAGCLPLCASRHPLRAARLHGRPRLLRVPGARAEVKGGRNGQSHCSWNGSARFRSEF